MDFPMPLPGIIACIVIVFVMMLARR